MKRFHELTKGQQVAALQYAERTMNDLLLSAAIQTDRPLDNRTTMEIVVAMAEHAWYSEREDHVVADIADGK
jgi:hypothetical protein